MYQMFEKVNISCYTRGTCLVAHAFKYIVTTDKKN